MNDNVRHAYMIMAHHRFDILEELLKDLDDARNDIFLHIDVKAKDFPTEYFSGLLHRARLILVERMDIHWGGYSQIECVTKLLKAATSYGYHLYYHFMVGVEFPLKTQNYIHDFFQKNAGYEFVGFDNYDTKFEERVRYYHIFNAYARNNNFFQKILNKIRICGVAIHKVLKVDISKKNNIIFKKGNANWSITHDLACYIVEHEKETEKIYRHSFCGDELFIHTLIYNSGFWMKVYDRNDEYHSSMRMMTWEDPYNQYHVDDLNKLIDSERLFARKIDGEDAMELIALIKANRDKEYTI
ncbi:MAG: glycosyl transferase [Acetatifactor sp.]|nr:glycosyl transferase [Acetatifactor sp.]